MGSMELVRAKNGDATIESAAPVVTAMLGKRDSTVAWDSGNLESRGVVTTLLISQIKVNPDNPRDGDWQNETADLFKEISRDGYDKSQALTVVIKASVLPDDPAERDATEATVIRGNRRLTVVQRLAKENPERFAEIFPDGRIPVVVFGNLSKTDRAILTLDFGKGRKRRELNPYEMFLAVRMIVKAGTSSQADIGVKLGKSRSWAQKMVALSKLPAFVVEAFRPVLLNKLDETKLRMQDVLFVSRDYVANSGDAFAAIWTTWVDGTHPDGQAFASARNGQRRAAGSIDYADLHDRVNTFDSPIMREVIGGTDAGDFVVELDNRLVTLEADAAITRKLRDTLPADEFAALMARIA